jgi:hypothetical protein
MATPILAGDKLRRYAERRLFGQNVEPKDVHHIVIHNGLLPSEVRSLLGTTTPLVQVTPREPLYFKDGVLHIPQYSGFGRQNRYERLIDAYIEVSDHAITRESAYRGDDPGQAAVFYENFAYDLLKPLFLSGMMDDVQALIFGNISASAKSIPGKDVGNEYLDTRLLDISGKKALNLNYVYADQAGILTSKALRWFNALAQRQQRVLTTDIFMFGKVGGLSEHMHRHDLVYPQGVINQPDMDRTLEEKLLVTPMHNILADSGGHSGWNLNVMSVLDETKEMLEQARSNGCICAEMETFEVVSALNVARNRYRGRLNVEFGFVGYVSDNPLLGDTLDIELDSDLGEQRAVQRILERMNT